MSIVGSRSQQPGRRILRLGNSSFNELGHGYCYCFIRMITMLLSALHVLRILSRTEPLIFYAHILTL